MTENRLNVGDTAPAFALADDAGNTVSLADYAGQRVLVYFYPRANTPGCTLLGRRGRMTPLRANLS